jgi:hypothetical protein
MKASQLRSASLLIEQLDALQEDLAAVGRDADLAHVAVTAKGKTIKYKPLKGIYKEFLMARKAAIEGLLREYDQAATTPRPVAPRHGPVGDPCL